MLSGWTLTSKELSKKRFIQNPESRQFSKLLVHFLCCSCHHYNDQQRAPYWFKSWINKMTHEKWTFTLFGFHWPSIGELVYCFSFNLDNFPWICVSWWAQEVKRMYICTTYVYVLHHYTAGLTVANVLLSSWQMKSANSLKPLQEK